MKKIILVILMMIIGVIGAGCSKKEQEEHSVTIEVICKDVTKWGEFEHNTLNDKYLYDARTYEWLIIKKANGIVIKKYKTNSNGVLGINGKDIEVYSYSDNTNYEEMNKYIMRYYKGMYYDGSCLESTLYNPQKDIINEDITVYLYIEYNGNYK